MKCKTLSLFQVVSLFFEQLESSSLSLGRDTAVSDCQTVGNKQLGDMKNTNKGLQLAVMSLSLSCRFIDNQ